jgi:hypothetical protein
MTKDISWGSHPVDILKDILKRSGIEMTEEEEKELREICDEEVKESERIQAVLDGLGPEFAKNGVVRTVLRNRIKQEKRREAKKNAEDDRKFPNGNL